MVIAYKYHLFEKDTRNGGSIHRLAFRNISPFVYQQQITQRSYHVGSRKAGFRNLLWFIQVFCITSTWVAVGSMLNTLVRHLYQRGWIRIWSLSASDVINMEHDVRTSLKFQKSCLQSNQNRDRPDISPEAPHRPLTADLSGNLDQTNR